MGVLQTEFEFRLPRGYVDAEGTRHREGVMRLATAADEIQPHRDPRVRANPSYMTVIILSRVVTRLGTLEDVTPPVVEGLFVTDLAYLQDLYERINSRGADTADAVCPDCGENFEVMLGSDVASRIDFDGVPGSDDGDAAVTTESGVGTGN